MQNIKPSPFQSIELSICMLGPRSVGKTTVMTSVLFDSIKSIKDTKLRFGLTKDEDIGKFQKYVMKLRDAIEKGNASNLPASSVHDQFYFKLGTFKKPNIVKLSVHDYPGEYLENKQSEVYEFIRKSTIIMVAIDTPYLMEENGMYNEVKNKVEVVGNFLSGENNKDDLQDKMVLFVPLKCERYAHDGRIDEVTDRVQKVYEKTIASFKNNNIACVVAPIHTLGGIELDQMIDSIESEYIKNSKYRPYIFEGESASRYCPLFCSQPLYYLLSYVTNYYEYERNRINSSSKLGKVLEKWLNGILSYLRKDEEFYFEIKKVQRHMIYDKFGFRVLNENSIMKFY